MKTIAVMALLLASLQAQAINKCTGPDGSLTFQDAPCTGKGGAIEVRPASGSSKTVEPEPASTEDQLNKPEKRQTEAQRIEARIAASQKDRRKKDLETRIVPDAYAAIDRQREECTRAINALKNQKRLANNNLAGATWEGAISSEMTARATVCDTRNRELREDAERFRSECRALGGCP